MKLALVRQKYTPFGGAERFVEQALTSLTEQGGHKDFSVTLITREWPEASDGRAVRLCNPFYIGRLWRDWGFARSVRKIMADAKFDLVQSHERIPGCAIYRAGDGVHATWLDLRARAQGPLTRLATRLNPWHRYVLATEAAMFRHPDLRAVICNSAMVANDIAQRFGVAPGKLHVIYNSVDTRRFHPGLRAQHRARVRTELELAEDAPLILFVGSGFERKGVPQLLAALAAMRQQDAHVAIVGKDRREAKMRALAARLGIAGRVHFLGGQRDVCPFYGAADAFALPTLYDPFPNAALEGLACGLPVVTSNTCGVAELIKEGQNGYVCDALDIEALASALDRALFAKCAESKTPLASLDEMAQKLTTLYRQLLRPEG